MTLRDDLFEEKGGIFRAFICRHNDEGTAEAGQLRGLVTERLSAEMTEATDRNFLTLVVFSLEHHFGAYISGIHCDMWAAVSAETWGEDKTVVRVECDEVEDGIAAVWWFFSERSRRDETGAQ